MSRPTTFVERALSMIHLLPSPEEDELLSATRRAPWNRLPAATLLRRSTSSSPREIDADGPWKTADGIMVVESPALKGFQILSATPKAAKATSDEPWAQISQKGLDPMSSSLARV